jgi:hypothetical protein
MGGAHILHWCSHAVAADTAQLLPQLAAVQQVGAEQKHG